MQSVIYVSHKVYVGLYKLVVGIVITLFYENKNSLKN